MIKANSDKCNFYEQKKASGFSEEMIRKGNEIAVADRYTELSFPCNECSGCIMYTYESVRVMQFHLEIRFLLLKAMELRFFFALHGQRISRTRNFSLRPWTPWGT